MDKTLLEQWLCGAESIPPAPAAIAFALGLPIDEVADTTLLRTSARVRSLRFVLAVLHDLFASDVDVRIWLDTPRPELGGLSAFDALRSPQLDRVEQLAVAAWSSGGERTASEIVLRPHKSECTVTQFRPCSSIFRESIARSAPLP